jgi:hypothetical protein
MNLRIGFDWILILEPIQDFIMRTPQGGKIEITLEKVEWEFERLLKSLWWRPYRINCIYI